MDTINLTVKVPAVTLEQVTAYIKSLGWTHTEAGGTIWFTTPAGNPFPINTAIKGERELSIYIPTTIWNLADVLEAGTLDVYAAIVDHANADATWYILRYPNTPRIQPRIWTVFQSGLTEADARRGMWRTQLRSVYYSYRVYSQQGAADLLNYQRHLGEQEQVTE